MNVSSWIVICKKQSTCRYCKNHILLSTPVLKVRKGPTLKGWYITTHYHPNCWVESGIAYAEKQERKSADNPEPRGRKPLDMPAEAKAERFRLMSRMSSINFRVNVEMSKPTEDINVDKLIHFGKMKVDIMDEIEKVGGVPKSWQV